jgi:hypothetical protein
VPVPPKATLPTPLMVTWTLVGAQPAFEAYTTENVNVVAVVPLPGLTPPARSVTWCEAPLQLAADTGEVISSGAASSHRMSHPRRAERNIDIAPQLCRERTDRDRVS